MLEAENLNASLGILVLQVWHSYTISLTHQSILHIANSVALCYTEWTTEGCVTAEVNGDVVTCNCSHLTNFAILVNSSESTCMHLLATFSKLVPHTPSLSSLLHVRIFFHLTTPAARGCNAETTEFLFWPDTPASTTQSLRCPDTTTIINRTCNSSGVWESVDPSLCTPFTSINVVSVNVDVN